MGGPWILAALAATSLIAAAAGQAPDRPLFFREDWTETPAASPITQAHVSNADLVLALYGSGAAHLKKSHHDQPADDPFYLWSGDAEGPWAATLSHRRYWVDLRGPAKVRWRSRQSGFRRLHLLLRLPDDVWVISDQAEGESSDWRVHEFSVGELRWRQFDPLKVTEGRPAAPDLSRVVEVGFSDLMRGGGTPASSRLDWIEVYGQRVSRPAEQEPAVISIPVALDRRACTRPAAMRRSGGCTPS